MEKKQNAENRIRTFFTVTFSIFWQSDCGNSLHLFVYEIEEAASKLQWYQGNQFH